MMFLFTTTKCTLSQLCRHIPWRSLNVFLIIHLQYLMLTFAFFSCWAKHQLITLIWLTDWLSLPSVPAAALGIVLTSGCATSRHCQQQELPGVRIHCCGSDLCNSTPFWHPSTLHYICALLTLLLLRMWLWCEITLKRNIKSVASFHSCSCVWLNWGIFAQYGFIGMHL